MIRRSATRTAGNEARAHQLWKVVASGFSSSSRNGELQQQVVSPALGRHSGFDDTHPVREFRVVKATVPDAHATPRRREDFPQFPVRKDRVTEQFGFIARRENSWWPESRPSPSGLRYQRPVHSTSGWSTKLGKSPDQGSSLRAFWNGGGNVSLLSTKAREGEEEPQTREEAPARPKSIEDFQHEEIVGPTVERDESDTANEVRASLYQLTTFMTSLRTGFLLLGSVQLVAAVWSSYFHGVGLILGVAQDLAFVMSFLLAYLLHLYGSRVEFFSKIEERSRMRILTLSLQAHKMLSTFFFRSSFLVRAMALCSLLALLGDVYRFHSAVAQTALV